MTATWNVRDSDGLLVDTLPGLADALGMSAKRAAAAIEADPTLLASAPKTLQTEVKEFARKKPGGGTPPPIDSGSFVSWNGGKGRVDLVVTNGKVPGVTEDVEGTAKAPAARVVVYDSDGKATSKKIGASTHTLKRIPPIKGSREGKSSPDALVQVHADHDESCDILGRPDHCRVTGYAVKAVYDRGLDGYPGTERTSLSPQQWAMGRVQHFVKVASLDVARSEVGHDTDLLAPEHPLYREAKAHPGAAAKRTEGDETTRIVPADVQAQIKSLREGLDD